MRSKGAHCVLADTAQVELPYLQIVASWSWWRSLTRQSRAGQLQAASRSRLAEGVRVGYRVADTMSYCELLCLRLVLN